MGKMTKLIEMYALPSACRSSSLLRGGCCNRFSGQMPNEIGNMQSLTYMSANASSISPLSSFVSVMLTGTSSLAPSPAPSGTSPSCRTCSPSSPLLLLTPSSILYGNHFTGTLPSSLSALKHVTYMCANDLHLPNQC